MKQYIMIGLLLVLILISGCSSETGKPLTITHVEKTKGTKIGADTITTMQTEVSENVIITEEDFSFKPYWVNTTESCDFYKEDRKEEACKRENVHCSYERGVVRHTLDLNREERMFNCKVQIDTEEPPHKSGSEKVYWSFGTNGDLDLDDKAYTGVANVFEDHEVTFCCYISLNMSTRTNIICKNEILEKLC